MRILQVLALCLLSISSAFAQESGTGFYVGAGLGGAWGKAHSDPSGSISISSVYGSVSAGYDKQFDNGLLLGAVVGVAPLPGLFGDVTRPCGAACGGLPTSNAFKTQ